MIHYLKTLVKTLILIQCHILIVKTQKRGDISVNPLSDDPVAAGEVAIDVPGSFHKQNSTNSQQARFGPVASPFFFLCHTPRPGEPTDVGIDDVIVSINATGEKKLYAGYEPQTVYELLVSSNVQLDGFLLTGVHALTKEFTTSSHLHLPTSVASQNSGGLVCAILHSHISKRPRSRLSLMWVSPPAGTGCVTFLATGSLQEQILFKDLTVMEVCEKENNMLDKLELRRSLLTTKDAEGFVFKDDFENSEVDRSVWDEIRNGKIMENPFAKSGRSVVFQGNSSSLQTKPMDFSLAQHVQLTLGPGNCKTTGRVRLLLGSVTPMTRDKQVRHFQAITETPHRAPISEESDAPLKIESKIRSEVFPTTENYMDKKADSNLVELIFPSGGSHFGKLGNNDNEAKTDSETGSGKGLESGSGQKEGSVKLVEVGSGHGAETQFGKEEGSGELIKEEIEKEVKIESSKVKEEGSGKEEKAGIGKEVETKPGSAQVEGSGQERKLKSRKGADTEPGSGKEEGSGKGSETRSEKEEGSGRGNIFKKESNKIDKTEGNYEKENRNYTESFDTFVNHTGIIDTNNSGIVDTFANSSDLFDPFAEEMLSDQPYIKACSHWQEIDTFSVSNLQEVHMEAIPKQFRKKDICIKLERVHEETTNAIQDGAKIKEQPCWSLDNVAVVSNEPKLGPVMDDFDPIDPTNWLFFPGAQVKETCGSDGNSLAFDGTAPVSWVSTRHLDLSKEADFQSDAILYKSFSEENPTGWPTIGAEKESCPGNIDSLTFYKSGKRKICTPFVDGRSIGAVRLIVGLNSCSTGDVAKLAVAVEIKGDQIPFTDFELRTMHQETMFALPSKLQQDGIRVCIEQSAAERGHEAWNLRVMALLPWIPSNPKYFFQAQMNMKCGSIESKVDVEASSDNGKSWWSVHPRCIPGRCEGKTSELNALIANGIDSGWSLVTLPLPYIALTSNTRVRVRQLEQGNSIWHPSWAIDFIYIGQCLQGCNGHGLCHSSGKCKCEYGYIGDACEISERLNPLYVSEPFTGSIDTSANVLEASGGETSYQCGVVGTGQAAVFKGRELRFITTVDVNTTDAHLLQFHFRAGTVSDVGKCPGPDDDHEGIFVHYSCSGGTTWHLLQTLHPKKYKEPRHISIVLPPGARDSSCRFQIWQAEHSGLGKDMWAIDDLTVTSQQFNTIELSFEDVPEANNSLRFHLGEISDSCGRNGTMVFSGSSNNELYRLMETKSMSIGPSYMMQFDLTIGCDENSYTDDLNSTVVLEYSLNHGLTWQLVQRPCTPSTPGCESHFTRGTVYHVSEFNKWKRVTLRLPKHTWSPTTRLRLRQLETSDLGLPWAVDNLYIGHQCAGHCSGHGYCTTRGCRCDDEFHGHMCLPLHKLHTEIEADFDEVGVDSDIEKYDFHIIGGTLTARAEGCGTIVSENSLYFGAPGVRHFETDDLKATDLHSIMFHLVIGGDHGLYKTCLSSAKKYTNGAQEDVSFGSVVLEYSTDGGLSWDLIKELVPSEFRDPKQFHTILEDKVLEKAKDDTGVMRFRIWQPKHDAEDQWSIDNFYVKSDTQSNTLQADFSESSALQQPWLSVTKHSQKPYCSSDDMTQVMDSKDPLRMAVTNIMKLDEGDVISFQISVGCSADKEEGSPVKLEFSRDGGNSWELVQKGCLPKSLDCKQPHEPSMYWPGHHGPWHRVLIPVDHRLTHGDAQLRWVQDNPDETRGGEFALKDLYIGPPCALSCHGQGMCTASGICKCEKGYTESLIERKGEPSHNLNGILESHEILKLTCPEKERVIKFLCPGGWDNHNYVIKYKCVEPGSTSDGKLCGKSNEDNSGWLRDGFDGDALSPTFWDNADGAVVSAGCNSDHKGNVMFFSGDKHRFITTKKLDTRKTKYLVFDLKIGADSHESRCQKGKSPRDDVIVDYSTDNGLSWNVLQVFDPSQTTQRKKPFFITLPHKARTKQTRFRWWQTPPNMLENKDGEQAEWQLDNVMVLANETLPLNIVESFSDGLSKEWFMVNGGSVEKSCGKRDPSLVFSGHTSPRYAETWDFDASDAAVLQFDIMPGCENRKIPTIIHVEYSTNNGKTWNLLKSGCVPPIVKCDHFDLPSIYSSNVVTNWTRVTLPLPKSIAGERTRLRFMQKVDEGDVLDPASVWAIDNIFIGDSCPWMCSGHGYCQETKCTCDEGYFGEFCVPEKVLPCEVLDTLNLDVVNRSIWNDVQGAEISERCGAVVSQLALVFFKEGPRYATTIDLDMTGGQFVQFNLLMGCQPNSKKGTNLRTKRESSTDEEAKLASILIQYSTNGGVIWNVLKNIHFNRQNDPIFISVELSDFPEARSNSTRVRFWQPTHHGSLVDVWALDNVYIGGQPINPNVLYEDFNGDSPVSDAWIDWPSGQTKPTMCGSYESRSSLVSESGEGEHAIYSRDMNIDRNSMIQFDVKVGCGNNTIAAHNVTLEYSTDFGVTWTPLRLVKSLYDDSPDYYHELQTPTVYYPNSARGWERVTIPLKDLPVCGNVRFRWWQGFYHPKEPSVEWSLDNVYIGPSCPKLCTGHGYCINGDSCDCDENYEGGHYCLSAIQNDQEIVQDFEGDSFPSQFIRWSGAEPSLQCDVLSGRSLLFWQQGERMLVTKDLDLEHGSVIQFYLRLRCSEERKWHDPQGLQEQPLMLQYSKDGGISWNLITELSSHSKSMKDLPDTQHFTISLPDDSKTNATRVRWWQPSTDGVFNDQWAIDQIYIGSTVLGLPYFFDNGSGAEWLLRPGSKVEKACDFSFNGVHFSGNSEVRFADTPDIAIARKAFIQYEISIGCKETNHCYDVFLEYSVDHGKTWQLVREECLPSEPDCPESWSSSVMASDLYASLTQVTIILPKRARSKLTRFRFSQKAPWDPHHPWFLARVYIGDGCDEMCSGRGFCEAGKCSCHKGWTGEKCEKREADLPLYIADNFDEEPKNTHWSKIVGAKISEICGPIASKSALHFYGGCSRLLESVDIDLRKALFVQFDLRTGCLDPVTNETAGGDNGVLVQTSCDGGITWTTLRQFDLVYHESKYVWIELPKYARCLGGRVRWWQPGHGPRVNKLDWALDSVIIGGLATPPISVSLTSPKQLKFPLWLRGYNTKSAPYCKFKDNVLVLESTPSEPAIAQTSDIQIQANHSLYFRLALGCGALWDNSIEPVSLQYTRDFGRSWKLVRELCLPFNSSTCSDLNDESIFYAPQDWQYYVFPLNKMGPAKYVRFRWIQKENADVMGTHKWALADVFIGLACPHHCLGRGSCIDQKCHCDAGYSGLYCETILKSNIPYIKDTFKGPGFLSHWKHLQGSLLAPGCSGDLEEPPAATFQGSYTRAIQSRPIDTRSARFVLFTAQIGSEYGKGLCRKPDHRMHNVYLQYSIDGGIKWNLLRELDHNLYRKHQEDYIVLPREAMNPATVFRFWQPRLDPPAPTWSIDNVFIGGSEIGADYLIDTFDGEPTISEWLFSPHAKREDNYCEKGDNGSLVWQADHPGHRAITTQELIIYDGHVLQFKISVGCQQHTAECYNGPQVYLEFTKEGGASGWDLVRDSCLPETSPDPDCLPYVFHGPTIFSPDIYSSWARITIPLPEKTWSSTTQFRWVQDAGRGNKQFERILPWALDDVYAGIPCEKHCRGHGDCVKGVCACDIGYEGPTCEPHSTNKEPLPTSLIDGFEGGLQANWKTVTGGSIGLGCNSLAPYGHGKHLYFNGCGTRQATTLDLDTRRASKVMFVLRIGSHDGTRSCHVDLTNSKRIENKGVIFQYSSDNAITWMTIDIHNPLDFRKARRVAYSLPEQARQNGVLLRWWQPDHDGLGTDQWALDNVEIVLAQRKSTSKYEAKVYHLDDL